MRNTKNIILGAIGIFITVYTLLICISMFSITVERNKLEKRVSRALENVLNTYNDDGGRIEAIEQLKEDICGSADTERCMIDIRAMDLEKGIISVDVKKEIRLVTGKRKVLTCEKTAIVEKLKVEYPSVIVSFYVGDSLYKQYQITKGEVCPVPKVPQGDFIGWIEENAQKHEILNVIGNVWENQIYHAVMQ